MNIIKEPYDNFWDYLGPENIIVLPITLFVNKNGKLSVSNNKTKEAFIKFKNLAKRWGYLINNKIFYPTYRTSEVFLLGLPVSYDSRKKQDKYLTQGSLLYLAELADSMPNELFYLECFTNKKTIVSTLADTKNIVLLEYGSHCD